LSALGSLHPLVSSLGDDVVLFSRHIFVYRRTFLIKHPEYPRYELLAFLIPRKPGLLRQNIASRPRSQALHRDKLEHGLNLLRSRTQGSG
jgi:hypothetical protein